MNEKCIGRIQCASSAEITQSTVGIGFECLDREVFDPEKCYDLLGRTGVKWARCQTGWNRCEREKGVYTFDWLDDVVDRLRAQGVQPWFNVGFGNPIYMPDTPNPTGVGCVPTLYGAEVTAAWKRFVRALARHFRGRVREFEIWNEPNIVHFWYPGEPNGAQYAELVALTGAIIREEVPDCRIGACFAGLMGETPKGDARVLPYLEAFAATLPRGAIDFFCYHTYSWFPDAVNARSFAWVKQIMCDYGHTNLAYWNGECGHASWYPDNYGQYPWKTQGNEHRQAVWQLRRFFLDRDFGAERTSFFQMVDMWQKDYVMASLVQKKPAAQGILHGITYTPKKSYETIGCLATIFSGALQPIDHDVEPWYPDDPVEMAALQLIRFARNGRPTYTYWRPTFVEDEAPTIPGLELRINNHRVPGAMTDPVRVDLLTGEVFEIADKSLRYGVWTLRGLPMAEYPMMICDRATYAMTPTEAEV